MVSTFKTLRHSGIKMWLNTEDDGIVPALGSETGDIGRQTFSSDVVSTVMHRRSVLPCDYVTAGWCCDRNPP